MKKIRSTQAGSIVSVLNGQVKLAPLGTTHENMEDWIEITDLDFEHESIQEALRKKRIQVITAAPKAKDKIEETPKPPTITSEDSSLEDSFRPRIDADLIEENPNPNIVPEPIPLNVPKSGGRARK